MEQSSKTTAPYLRQRPPMVRWHGAWFFAAALVAHSAFLFGRQRLVLGAAPQRWHLVRQFWPRWPQPPPGRSSSLQLLRRAAGARSCSLGILVVCEAARGDGWRVEIEIFSPPTLAERRLRYQLHKNFTTRQASKPNTVTIRIPNPLIVALPLKHSNQLAPFPSSPPSASAPGSAAGSALALVFVAFLGGAPGGLSAFFFFSTTSPSLSELSSSSWWSRARQACSTGLSGGNAGLTTKCHRAASSDPAHVLWPLTASSTSVPLMLLFQREWRHFFSERDLG